jgi:hypothetical protein
MGQCPKCRHNQALPSYNVRVKCRHCDYEGWSDDYTS